MMALVVKIKHAANSHRKAKWPGNEETTPLQAISY